MTRLIGSAATLDALKALIKQRWTWDEVFFQEQEDGTFTVSTGTKLMDDLRVIKKRGRYRLEVVL